MKDSIFALMTPKLRVEVQCQLKENIGKTLKFMDNKKFVCSVKPASVIENEYNNKLNNFIATSFESSTTLKLNNFGTKYASFA